MNHWLVLLRAVNVGGNNRVPMAEMRELMADIGFTDISTHLQSGNVLCGSDQDRDDIGTTVRAGIADWFGHDIDVIVRSRTEVAAIVEAMPFEFPANSSSGVVFMNGAFDGELDIERFHPDVCVVSGSDIYVDLPTGFGATKLTAGWIEKHTGLRGTRRNWKTVKALNDKLGELDS